MVATDAGRLRGTELARVESPVRAREEPKMPNRTILHVAEKNSVAKSITPILSHGHFFKTRSGYEKYCPCTALSLNLEVGEGATL